MQRDFRDNLITADAKIIDTLRIIDGHGVPIGLVHDNGRLLGTVTDGDIRRGILAGILLDAPVSKVMNTAPICELEGTPDTVIFKRMQAKSILYVPIVNGRNLIVGLKVLKDMLARDGASAPLPPDTFDAPQSANPIDNPVVIMAGGKGERLRPLTEDRPKPMVEVGGRPILEIIVERFVHQGFKRIYLSVNYRKEMIEDYFGNGAKWGAEIAYIHEDGARGTVASLTLLPKTERLPVVVMNGDLVTRVNFRQLVEFHEQHGGPATMAVSEARFAVPYGVVTTNGNILASLEEKPVKSFFVNAGIYVIAPGVIEMINTPALSKHTINMNNLFSMLLSRAKDEQDAPRVFPLREYWIDVGRVEDLDQAQRDMRNLIKEV